MDDRPVPARARREVPARARSAAFARSVGPLLLVLFAPMSLPIARMADAAGVAADPRVYRDHVEPHWFAKNDRFWYRNDLRDGAREFVVVDASAGTRQLAFDHARLASELGKLRGTEVLPGRLPVEAIEFRDDGKAVRLLGATNGWWLDLDTYVLTPDPAAQRTPASLPFDRRVRPSHRTGAETEIEWINALDHDALLFWIDPEGNRQAYGTLARGETRRQHTFAGHVWLVSWLGTNRAVFEATKEPSRALINGREPEAPRRSQPSEETPDDRAVAPSPDGQREAFVRDHNLWIRDHGAKQEFALSYDGNPGNSFRLDVSRDRLIGMEYDKADPPATLPEVFWSPDGARLVALQTRSVPERRVYAVESSPADQVQPKLTSYPYLKAGDEIPRQAPRLFDVGARRETPIDPALFPTPWSLSGFRWASNSAQFSFVYNQRGHQVLRVVAADAASGATRAVVEERSATFIDYSGKFHCDWLSDDELLWMSERDGWNHLYLYDVPQGRVKRQVTRGPWVVRDVVRVDKAARQIWFRAAGIRPGQDPYYFHLARAGLDAGEALVLTEGDGTHATRWSPDQRYFIDTWSRVDQPPITELRRAADGARLCALETAEAGEVIAARGRLPERFVANGRDGTTDIHGILHRPRDFDRRRRYPVVESIYAGPHDFHVPKAFRARYRQQEELADRGFVVVQIDGMGTSWRSKAFHDVCWRNLKDAGFPDRIAWLKAAAAKFPELDLTRVGIYGGSAGGQNAMAALLWHGDFYHAAVADCGCHDNRMDKIWWSEQWMGWPVGPHYEENSNAAQAQRLQGHLLLLVGELDRNVDPSSTLQVVRALQKADKDFDFQIIVGTGHGAAETPYGSRLRSEFLARHLLGPGPAAAGGAPVTASSGR